MLELHSNFTFQGSKEIVNGVLPTNHALHETVEITHGFSDWFETGFYVFTSAKNGYGLDWVGDHIRPRVAIPEKWKWPVGLSLSAEVGYQRPTYSEDKWTVELRPIIDKKTGRWYWAFNPTFDKSLRTTSLRKSPAVSNTTVRLGRSRTSIRFPTSSSRYFQPLTLIFLRSGKSILGWASA
jgi:hypothetical protein